MSLDKLILHQAFSEKFEGLIWKILVNEENGLMAIESRNSEVKKVAFTVLTLENGCIHFKEESYEEPWNLNLAYAGKENLVLTAYDNSNSPESKGIISVNIKDGSVLWQRYNLALQAAYESGLQVYDSRINPRNYSWINHLTAETLSEPGINFQGTGTLLIAQLMENFILPDFIEAGQLQGEFSVLNFKGLNFVSFHEQIENYMQQRLIVYQNDSILLDDILISGIQKLQPEAFFIQNDHLFYIRNKNEIVSYLV